MIQAILESILTLGGIGFISALGLGFAARKFAVEIDPKITEITNVLPGANCGGCGFAGCADFAQAAASGIAPVHGCLVGGSKTAGEIASIMGVESSGVEKKVARLLCQGTHERAQAKYIYHGVNNCRAAASVAGGGKSCAYGCLGLGSCVGVCPVGAISQNNQGLISVDENKCIGCGKCVIECPKKVLDVVAAAQKVTVLCNSRDKGPVVKKICTAGCIGCGLCKKFCPIEGAIAVDNFLARIDPAKCNGCKICVEKCPSKSIVIK